MDGGSLHDILDAKDRRCHVNLDQRLRILEHAADGLAHLHRRNVCHKDLKPSNILLKIASACPTVSTQYIAKLSDLGLSKVLPGGQVDKSKLLKGTLQFLDPWYLEHELYGKCSDVYSFGLIVVMVVFGTKSAVEAKQLASDFGRLDLSIEEAEALLQHSCIPGDKPAEVLWDLMQLGVACMNRDPSCRPCMDCGGG